MTMLRFYSVEVGVGYDPETDDLDLKCTIAAEPHVPANLIMGSVPTLLRTVAEKIETQGVDRVVDLGPEPRPCPECASGKCINCTGTVPLDDDMNIWETCACKEAGHVR